MVLRLIICLNAAFYLALIPLLEIGPTHVFNPDWPAHAKLHEVWQLVTHGLLSLLCVIFAWRGANIVLAAIICLAMNGGFLAALGTASLYGGGMMHSDGTQLNVLGVNPAMAVILALSLGIVVGMVMKPALRKARPSHG